MASSGKREKNSVKKIGATPQKGTLPPTNNSQRNIELPEDAKILLEFSRHPWPFFRDAVWTKDQADKVESLKKYPDKEYLQYTVDKMYTKQLFAMVKHRRMIVTWTGCGLMTWDTLFLENRMNVIISKKEEDSDELVQRCKFIYDNIPRDIMRFKPEAQYKYCSFKIPELGSEIKGIAQGADQLRQYTCSRILADEMAFWPHAKQTFVAMKPTIQGGGQIALISTRFPGFFKQIIEDTIND